MYGYPQDNVGSHNRHHLGHHPQAPPPLHMPDRISHQPSQQHPTYMMPSSHQIPQAPQPPLHLIGPMSQQPATQQQQHSRQQSSSEMTAQAEPERPMRPCPRPLITVADGRIWELEVRQQPVRARMCGFGDKDRRPITPPPCVRLIVKDQHTGKEVNVNDIDTSFYVLLVDIWDENGDQEMNIVKTANGGSPSISTASTIPFPPATYNLSSSQYVPSASTSATYYSPASAQPASANSYHSMGSFQGAYGSAPSSAYSQPYSPQQFAPRTNGYPVGPITAGPNAYQHRAPSPTTPTHALPSYPGHIANSQPYAQSPASQTPNSSFTRNLIGSLSASAFRLHDEHEKHGVWFVLQDLSVRTEGNFRLKFNFMNLSVDVNSPDSQSLSGQQSLNNTAATAPSSPHTASMAASASQRQNHTPATQHNTTLNTGFAPVLAYAFSEPFTVFSAKRFPGVIESTGLSRTFAAQGIKIPIRKDNEQKNGNGKRPRRDGEVEDEEDDLE